MTDISDSIIVESARMAVQSDTSEETALAAVTMISAAPRPDPQLLVELVANARRSVAAAAIDALFRNFGEQTEKMARIVASLKAAVTSDHPHFDMVEHM